jgi:transcriptional regulator with XRE-family HTH domain
MPSLLRNPESLRSYVGRGPGKVMSGAELARRVGRSRSTIDHLLNGRMSSCTDELAADIETVLNAPAGVIFVAATPSSGASPKSSATR